jgi:hypothetical protein
MELKKVQPIAKSASMTHCLAPLGADALHRPERALQAILAYTGTRNVIFLL